jgi:hypothetical protein
MHDVEPTSNLRNKLLLVYIGTVIATWAVAELRWWWWRKMWRAHAAVPWTLRRSLQWPPPK